MDGGEKTVNSKLKNIVLKIHQIYSDENFIETVLMFKKIKLHFLLILLETCA